MQHILSNRLDEKLIWLLTTFLFAADIIFETSTWSSVVLIVITFAILFFDALQGRGIIRPAIGPYHFFVLCFCLFCYASSLWARSADLAISKGTTIFEILVCTSVIYMHYAKYETVAPLVEAIRWAGYIVVLYAFFIYGSETIWNLASTGGRLLNSFANINSIGMMAAYSAVITAFRVLFINKRITWTDLFVIPAIVLIGLSGSRKTLVLAAAGFVILVMKRFGSKNIAKTVIQWSLLGVLILVLFRFLLTLPIFEAVKARMVGLIAMVTGVGEVDHSTWLRQQYIALGLEQFWKTPLLGIGIDNARFLVETALGRRTYLQSKYVELLADGGIVGFFCYYVMYLYPLWIFYRYRRDSDPYLILCVVLMLLFLVMDYGMVSYYSKSTYFYLSMLFLEARILSDGSRERKL